MKETWFLLLYYDQGEGMNVKIFKDAREALMAMNYDYIAVKNVIEKAGYRVECAIDKNKAYIHDNCGNIEHAWRVLESTIG